MKKTNLLIAAAITAAVQTGSPSAFAAPGDIAGQYYSTDIVTTLNGVEIDSINIGGQTLISAEDMQYYSFSVYWMADERELDISSIPNAMDGAPPAVVKPQLPPGTPAGNYYETDIVTKLDGKVITAYNIGGRTYLHAEQMRDFGYSVDWNSEERTLAVVSPDRAGYVYSIPLTSGSAVQADGCGSAAVSFDNGRLTGRGDTAYFDSQLHFDGKNYTITMSFYQNEGLFYSHSLTDKFSPLAYSGYGVETETDPAEKYDDVRRVVKISVNGKESEKIGIIRSAGNGHQDYWFVFSDIPKYTKDEIRSIYFAVDDNSSLPEHEIVLPEYHDKMSTLLKLMKKNKDDFIQSTFDAGEYTAVDFYESESLGVVRNHLYLVRNSDMKIMYDILDEVRKFEGYSDERLYPFAYKVGDIKNNLLFSCGSEQRNGDFYVEMDSGTVHKISEYIK